MRKIETWVGKDLPQKIYIDGILWKPKRYTHITIIDPNHEPKEDKYADVIIEDVKVGKHMTEEEIRDEYNKLTAT